MRTSKLVLAMKNNTVTLNNAPTFKSSLNANLDFFSRIGGMRGNTKESLSLFREALQENPELALKNLFHLRNVRGGIGERDLFRQLFLSVSELTDDNLFETLLSHVPYYGRWDDVFIFFGTNKWPIVVEFLRKQLETDYWDALSEKPISLAAKWFPSINSHSKATRLLAEDLAASWELTPRRYRKILSFLRKRLDVVERKMSANKWEEIEYKAVPSRASMVYRGAFKRHDEERYNDYINSVLGGKTKINASVLYPHELVKLALSQNDKTVDALWKNLKLETSNKNVLVIADVSGSMLNSYHANVTPLHVSIGLALFLAERIEGAFQNYFITFTSKPTLQEIKGKTLLEKISNISGPVGYDTNLQSAFDLVLSTATRNSLSQDDMPEYLLVVTDMEFNSPNINGGRTNFEVLRRKYQNAGYEMPKLIFWNIDAKTQQSPVTFNQNGVGLVSGFSPSVLKNILTGKWSTPEQLMLETLSMYDRIFE